MRIDDPNRLPQIETSQTNRPATIKPSDLAQTTSSTDLADLSGVANQLTGADPSRLEMLRAAIENGEYQVSPSDLADSLIAAHLKP